MDREIWQAIVHRVAKGQTWLKWLSTHACCPIDTKCWFLAQRWLSLICDQVTHSFSFFFFYAGCIFKNFNRRLITLQYCGGFCHTFTWISHGCTCVPHPDPTSYLPPHPIPQGHPSAPVPSTLPHASNLDWCSISHFLPSCLALCFSPLTGNCWLYFECLPLPYCRRKMTHA